MLASKLIKLPPVPVRFHSISQTVTTVLHLHQDTSLAEYTDTPNYPKILDTSREAAQERAKKQWHEKVTNLPTVEQKMIELNMPRYYGHWACHLKDDVPSLLSAPFCQFATRTHVAQGLPQGYYEEVWEEAEAVADKVAGQVEQLITLNYNVQLSRRVKETPSALARRRTQNFLYGLHRVLSGALHNTPHIREALMDMRPRIEAYWILGSLPPDNMIKKWRRSSFLIKHTENDPVERPMQGFSSPALGVRVQEGLPEVVARDDPLATRAEVPTNDLDPRSFRFKFKHRHATTVTGVWPSEGKQHGHLFIHTREFENRHKTIYGAHHLPDAFRHKAVVASFTQAQAHATYLGFGPVTELTYPLVQQSAFTDGQRWNLSLYQLNTCALHSDNPINNPHNNILWLSEEQQLFDSVEGDGVRGLNTSLLASLLAMYLKKGTPNPDPTPYLPLKHVANHPAIEEYRGDFHKMYLHLASNRPRHIEMPELYQWEKIYKVDFKTRPLDPPRRFFEPHYNQKMPGATRLDDHNPRYIPKDIRKHKRVKHKPRLNTEHLYKYD